MADFPFKDLELGRDGWLVKHFTQELEAIAGVYLNAPEHAVVMCVDEKSQIQALDRRQPDCRLRKVARNQTHDYKRQGTAMTMAPRWIYPIGRT